MMLALGVFAGLALGYLVGSVPSAALGARLQGGDIFKIGGGNMGAMNAARNVGWGLGVLVLGVDLAKGALASSGGLWLAAQLGLVGLGGLLPALAAGVGAVLGHLWSVWVGFRGGKGLSTTLGVSLPLYPLGGLYALATLLLLILGFRHVTRAALLTALAYPLLVFVSLRSAPLEVAAAITGSVSLIALLVAFKHLQAARTEARG